jgi:hypothetical protein
VKYIEDFRDGELARRTAELIADVGSLSTNGRQWTPGDRVTGRTTAPISAGPVQRPFDRPQVLTAKIMDPRSRSAGVRPRGKTHDLAGGGASRCASSRSLNAV